MKLISLLRALMYALALETTTSSSAPVPANVLWNALPCSRAAEAVGKIGAQLHQQPMPITSTSPVSRQAAQQLWAVSAKGCTSIT